MIRQGFEPRTSSERRECEGRVITNYTTKPSFFISDSKEK